MVAATYIYRPDYAVPPGWVLEEHLKSHSLSPAELARRCGRSAKLISEIIAGKALVEPKTALQFEKVLGLDASIWLALEAPLSASPGPKGRGDRDIKGLCPGKDFSCKGVSETREGRRARL